MRLLAKFSRNILERNEKNIQILLQIMNWFNILMGLCLAFLPTNKLVKIKTKD